MIRDSASMSVMIETIGSRNVRWLQRKRDDFLTRNASKHGGASGTTGGHRLVGSGTSSAGRASMPHSIVRQNSRLQHAMSSLSSSSGSSTGNGSGAEEEQRQAQRWETQGKGGHNADAHGSRHAAHHTHAAHSDEKKQGASSTAKKVSSSSSSNDTHQKTMHNSHGHGGDASNDFHDYHAPSLPDPLLPESGGSSPSSDERQEGEEGDGMDSDNCVVGGKNMCTDSSSSGDDEKPSALEVAAAAVGPSKKRKLAEPASGNSQAADAAQAVASSGITSALQSSGTAALCRQASLPPNIARTGGILHNVKAVVQQPATASLGTATAAAATAAAVSLPNGHANLSRAPPTALPPFVGIGKRKHPPAINHQSTLSSSAGDGSRNNGNQMSSSTSKPLSVLVPNNRRLLPPLAHDPNRQRSVEESNDVNGSGSNNNDNTDANNSSSQSHRHSGRDRNIITIDNDTTTSSQSSSQRHRGIQAHYYINEDDMILTDDVLMCPFIFRSQEAVWCGALAECVQPGMLRACFSSSNKLRNVEMIFDAMGFCQQLERASGNEGMAQIIPNSLEMALAPNSEEARVITLAKPPFRIVSVNEAWTAMTGYTQLDAEGKDLSMLYGERTDPEAGVRGGMPPHDFESVAKGVCAASTNIHYGAHGREILTFMCSYPLSNMSDEVTHILHTSQELPAR